MLIHDNFLLHNELASRLFHEYAQCQPILDYHCHLPPKDIAQNRRFHNLAEIWLEGDHYKWRAMRANGVEETYCTGSASAKEKFLAWARTVPHTLCNPLYHWTHLELKRYFDIDQLLDESTAESIWEAAETQLATPELSAQGILKKFDVRALCTTDDPVDDLAYHRQIRASHQKTRVFPAFRPDRALGIADTQSFNDWTDRLERAADAHIVKLTDFQDALASRHAYFHELGGRLSDHGLECCSADFPSDVEAQSIFDRARAGRHVSREEESRFAAHMMLYFAQLDAQRGWTQQLHLGASRNNHTTQFKKLGPDTGFDAIGDFRQGAALVGFLDRCATENALPRTIVYNLNPADNYLVASILSCFQDGRVVGKMQLGSGWWFLDQKEAMQWQMRALANVGLLSHFVGMLTDSRSFMSYPRHEYFRRVLCNLLGEDMQNGELPLDISLVGEMVRRICYQNAHDYLRLDIPATTAWA